MGKEKEKALKGEKKGEKSKGKKSKANKKEKGEEVKGESPFAMDIWEMHENQHSEFQKQVFRLSTVYSFRQMLQKEDQPQFKTNSAPLASHFKKLTILGLFSGFAARYLPIGPNYEFYRMNIILRWTTRLTCFALPLVVGSYLLFPYYKANIQRLDSLFYKYAKNPGLLDMSALPQSNAMQQMGMKYSMGPPPPGSPPRL